MPQDSEAARAIKRTFAPDGGAEREHNADAETLGFGAIHEALVINLRPKRVLVIGSRYGFVPAVIGVAMREHGGAMLDFVDANYSDAENGFAAAYGGVGYWSSAAATESFAAFGLQDIVRLHFMRSDTFFAGCSVRYDYVYLDGDHSYEGCRRDFDRALEFCNPGAAIVLHDVMVSDPLFGVGRLFDELDPSGFDKILIRRWPGLGIVMPKEGAR